MNFGDTIDSSAAADEVFYFNPGTRSVRGFHCYALLDALLVERSDGSARRAFEDAFMWSLWFGWSFIGTLGSTGGIFLANSAGDAAARSVPRNLIRRKPEWHLPYLKACLAHWRALERVGSKFALQPGFAPQQFTVQAYNLKATLVDCGAVTTSAQLADAPSLMACVNRGIGLLEARPAVPMAQQLGA